MVTGLVVNKKVNIKREYYRYARSMCNALFTKGACYHHGSNKIATIRQLEGILSRIHFIKSYGRTEAELLHHKKILNDAKKHQTRPKFDDATELYSNFLYFRYFVALDKPLIVCEGKTDPNYLKSAINQLKKETVSLFPHVVDFFPFERRVKEVMRIHNGASALKNFVNHYEANTQFKFQTRQHPVIVLLDNDHEAEKMIKLLKGKFKNDGVSYDRSSNCIYPVLLNLYVMLLPRLNSTSSNKIEDFLDSSVKETKLGGKTFSEENRNSKFDN
jgi:RNA-directed DNA polymerase